MGRLQSRWGICIGSSALLFSVQAWGQTSKKAAKPVESAGSAILFPDWNADAFSIGIGPIMGVRARKTEVEAVRYDVISSEIGLGARIHGIPLVPGNPGLTVEPYASYTWGNRSEKRDGAAINATESSGFQRQWYGLMSRAYVKFFRYSLDLGRGKINHDDDYFEDVSSNRIMNDFAVLILPFLSAHYTLTSLTATVGNNSKPSIDEVDHWLHGRVAFSVLDFQLDFGPGQTVTKFSGRLTPDAPFKKIATVNTNYLKALASMHVFWKLGASGSVKYIYAGENKEGLDDVIEQLPNEGLTQRKSLANLPDGSLESTAFFGLKNLFGGFGVGWQFYYLEANLVGDKVISRDQGFAVIYDVDI